MDQLFHRRRCRRPGIDVLDSCGMKEHGSEGHGVNSLGYVYKLAMQCAVNHVNCTKSPAVFYCNVEPASL